MNEKVVAKSNRIQFHISLFIRVTVFISFVISLFEMQLFLAFGCFLTFFSLFLPGILDKNLKVKTPTEFEFFISLFLYAALFLGEIENFYERFWWWDVMLHALSGIILSFSGFLILLVLYSQKRLFASPPTFAIFSFCFGLALGTVWEIFEFMLDQTLGLHTQNNSLFDTMKDLIVDAIGALFTSILAFLYIKYKRSPIGFFDHMLQKFLSRQKN